MIIISGLIFLIGMSYAFSKIFKPWLVDEGIIVENYEIEYSSIYPVGTSGTGVFFYDDEVVSVEKCPMFIMQLYKDCAYNLR